MGGKQTSNALLFRLFQSASLGIFNDEAAQVSDLSLIFFVFSGLIDIIICLYRV
jgi:hypothetical protein